MAAIELGMRSRGCLAMADDSLQPPQLYSADDRSAALQLRPSNCFAAMAALLRLNLTAGFPASTWADTWRSKGSVLVHVSQNWREPRYLLNKLAMTCDL